MKGASRLMVSYGLTHKGLVRKANQDSFIIENSTDKTLAVVCDGIGGNKAGEVASAVSSKDMQMIFKAQNKKATSKKWLVDAIEEVNSAVFRLGNTKEEYKGMGTTLVTALVTDKSTYVANVGDSRCYILTDKNEMIQVTEDHTLINYLVKTKGINEEIASKMVGKNVIARAIGIGNIVEIDTFEVLNDYKCLLLCSDGLHGYVKSEDIKEVLVSDSTVEDKCMNLVKLANDAGGFDNVTVVICQR